MLVPNFSSPLHSSVRINFPTCYARKNNTVQKPTRVLQVIKVSDKARRGWKTLMGGRNCDGGKMGNSRATLNARPGGRSASAILLLRTADRVQYGRFPFKRHTNRHYSPVATGGRVLHLAEESNRFRSVLSTAKARMRCRGCVVADGRFCTK